MDRSPAQVESAGMNEEQRRTVLEQTLVRSWRVLLGVQTIDVHSDFFQSGGRPEHAESLVSQIREETAVRIRASDLYEARTIAKLADLILMKQSSREQMCIVPIREQGTRRPVFLVHGVGGNILGFAGLARSLSPEQPVYGIQAQALNSEMPTLIRIEAMAQFYIQQLQSRQPVGPYAFLGFSFGGLVAYEMAQQLTEAGEQVSFLGMLDTWQPGQLKAVKHAAQPMLRRTWGRLRLVRLNTQKLSLLQLTAYLGGRVKGRVLRIAFGRFSRSAAVNLPESMRQVRDINLTAAARYTLRPYSGKIILFRAVDDDDQALPEDLNWRAYARGGVDLIRLPGDHGQILAEPNLSFMTRQLEALLAPAATTIANIEEFELDDDGLTDLKDAGTVTPPLPPSQLIPAWASGASMTAMDSLTVYGSPPHKAMQ